MAGLIRIYTDNTKIVKATLLANKSKRYPQDMIMSKLICISCLTETVEFDKPPHPSSLVFNMTTTMNVARYYQDRWSRTCPDVVYLEGN
jgi:hypothetical protein